MDSNGLPVRLRNNREFRRVYEQGRRYSTPFFNAFILRNDLPEPRLGLTVTRKIGNSVVRNRCKRRLREIVRHCFMRLEREARLPAGFDLVLNARSNLPLAQFSELEIAFEKMIEALLRTKA